MVATTGWSATGTLATVPTLAAVDSSLVTSSVFVVTNSVESLAV